jgi:hypothetical protein
MSYDQAFDWAQAEEDVADGISTTVPHSARVWDYWLGGKDHYEADREAGDKVLAAFPGIADSVRQLRYFTTRTVRYLAAGAGIRQFLDIGTGLPFRDPVHEVALAAAPGCRIAYADNDIVVLAHARALLTGPPGTVTYIAATLDDPAALLAAARDWLDFTQPVAVLVMSTLGHIGDPGQDDDHVARAVTACLKDALPAGGDLAIGDLVTHPDLSTALEYYNTTGAAPYRARTPEQFDCLFDGLELTEPGSGPVSRWRPGPGPFAVPEAPAWGAVGRKR